MQKMSPEEYRQRAEECDRLAESVTSPRVRETMQYMASRWRALAEAPLRIGGDHVNCG
jgi:hypothetical protein